MGRTVLVFTPASYRKSANTDDDGLYYNGECPICVAHDYMPNAEIIAAIEEGRAMIRDEIPAKCFSFF